MALQFSKLTFAALVCCLTLIISACGSAGQQESSGASVTIEAQTVPEATPTTVPTATPTLSPTPEPVSADLPTELVEPISPVSPVAKEMNASTDDFPGSELPVNAAIADLSEKTGTPEDQISIVSIEAKDWPDSSLGCPEEGFMYAQVITPGYLVVLEADGQQYNYHTDEIGKNVVLCEQ